MDDQIQITYRGKQVTVKVIVSIEGHDLVVVDSEGRVYTTWWEVNADQAAEPLRVQQRHWRRYTVGIYDLRRALLHSLVTAEQTTIPTLEELQKFCQRKGAEIRILKGNVAKELEQLTPQFTELADFLAGKIRWPLVKGSHQLHFFLLLRDSLGRLNVGVLSARLTTINARLTDELKHLAGWMPHYAARLSAIRMLQDQFQTVTREIQTSLQAMKRHEAFTKNKTTRKQVAGIVTALDRQVCLLIRLQHVQPFTKWAKYCQADLNEAKVFATKGAFDQALELINRILEAMKLRVLSFEIEELIAQLSLDIRLDRVAGGLYRERINLLIAECQAIDETGFTQPVCRETVLPELVKAQTAAVSDQWKRVKNALKRAAAAI
ncbi:MAG: hypothetical protein WC768_03760 [Patescibacteria group bacterium]